ncbi:hypothetical protein GCM10010435_40530 [Winogradskya consettensis]|uniref:Spore-associated protein A n=1 Tax=Winogradskya consettensis TaxID=113560 RepID=A0A919SDG1_9ACTN|nr:hypothetical protein [Actinoplanes consettensis]GIM69725.1 hypothetical protein Aco04nite_16660 [Actinoplanes consettensis]
MISLRRTGLSAALLLTPLLSLAALAPAPASAAVTGSCSGTEIDTAAMKSGSHTYGTLHLYYNSSTGKNCAKATNVTGAARDMSVWVLRCFGTSGPVASRCNSQDGPVQNVNYDSGHYSSYAGPVNTKGSAAGTCINAGSTIEVGSITATAQIYGHCG